jgi:aspartyl-tRNA(Asn)/glutamyl-tRNA(Gln) amidotransferase subunit A
LVRQSRPELQRSITELAELLKTREVSSLELTTDCLARIEKLSPALNAFITITADSALAQANAADAEIRRGRWRGPLHGIPLGLKDLIDTAEVLTTAASAVFKDRIPNQDAEVVTRLKAAGAVLIGKQNLHEFAYGGSSLVSYYGDVRNPWNVAHTAGGSSGGSAAAVAAGLCYGAIGTDTAGSIREPAALCGVVGLKPTYGCVSVRGVIPLSPSLDHVGPIARTVADAAIMLRAIADIGQYDWSDGVNFSAQGIKPLRIGVPRKFFFEDLDPEVGSAVEEALSVLQSLGHLTRIIDLAVPQDRTLQSGEAYAYHSDFVARSPELYQPETLRRIRSGENISPADILRLREELQQTRRDIKEIFEKVDVLVTPTTPIPAPLIADLRKDPDSLRPREILLLRNTRPANVWGLPAISLPCGFTNTGLPIGLQIMGAHWAEAKVLQLACEYVKSTAWHKHEPTLSGM